MSSNFSLFSGNTFDIESMKNITEKNIWIERYLSKKIVGICFLIIIIIAYITYLYRKIENNLWADALTFFIL